MSQSREDTTEKTIGPFTERDFDNDLREGRGKMSDAERDELEAMVAANKAKADELRRKKTDAG